MAVVVTLVMTARERRRQERLAETRSPLDGDEFKARLVAAGVDGRVAQFVWDEFQPYYFASLTPYPEDRPISEMRIDSDDLSDIEARFEKQFGRHWLGEWIGSHDPTLVEFAQSLMNSTSA
jgi:hypothetical protein